MSLKVQIDTLSQETRDRFMDEMEIRIEPSKYAYGGRPTFVYPYEIVEDSTGKTEGVIYVPFAYGSINGVPRPISNEYPESKVTFTGELYDVQKIVKSEATKHLNKRGCSLISAYPGFGKCLGFNTPVIMYDGNIKMVQDITEGEQLMGDDSTPRNVLSTCTGQEKMYNIVPIKGDTFGCNESHILSLKFSGHKAIIWDRSRQSYFVRWLDKEQMKFKSKYLPDLSDSEAFRDSIMEDSIVDISVKDYLELPIGVKCRLKLFKVGVEFESKDVDMDPYLLGLWLGDGTNIDVEIMTAEADKLNLRLTNSGNFVSHTGKTKANCFRNFLVESNLMSNKHIPYKYKCNDRATRLSLLAGLIDSDGYLFKNCYEIAQKNTTLANDIVYLARSLGFAANIKKVKGEKRTGTYNLVGIYGEGLEDIPLLLNRKRALPRQQIKDPNVTGFKVVPIEDTTYYGFCIDGNHRFLLGDFTVTHNTMTALKLSSKIPLRRLIIVNRIPIINQWIKAIGKWLPEATVQFIKPGNDLQDCDFYIMNAINVCKNPREFYASIGFVIIDECHRIVSAKLSQLFKILSPRYLLGLSATPYRPDDLHPMLERYFGNWHIFRPLYHVHTVYEIRTKFVPVDVPSATGKTDFTKMLASQCECEARNDMIVRIVCAFPERNFLITSKRVEQAEYIRDKLVEEKENVTTLIGSNQEFDETARILVATIQKVGEGFDHNKLDALICASDQEEYFIQCLGRVFRTRDVVPIVFDIVDKHRIFTRHYATRRAVYLEAGGKIKIMQKEFPNIELC
jgi:hypothetical protein